MVSRKVPENTHVEPCSSWATWLMHFYLPVKNYAPDESQSQFMIAIDNVSSSNIHQLNLEVVHKFKKKCNCLYFNMGSEFVFYKPKLFIHVFS